MINISKTKKVGKDFVLSFIASILTIAIAHVLLFPMLSRMYSANHYGVILTLYGVANTVLGTFGGSLNNTRLIVNEKYDLKNEGGDFMPLLFLSTIIGFLVILIYDKVYTNIGLYNIVLLTTYTVFGIIGGYGSATYRLQINYTKNLIYCFLIGLGQAVGLMVIFFLAPNLWALPFALGQVFGCMFLFVDSDIFREAFKITGLFIVTLRKYLILIMTTFSASILTYLDRLLLLPMLGGDAVSAYTTAAFFGKTLGMVATPIAGVFLTYFAQKGFEMTKMKFWVINAIIAIGGVTFFIASFLIAEPITRFMYPDIVDSSLPYLRIANLVAIISLIANMTQPSVLMFAKTYWQIVIQIAYCVAYLGLGVIGVYCAGLWGFAVAALVASIVRLSLLYFVGHISIGAMKEYG